MVYFISRNLFKFLLTLFFRFRVFGKRNVPRKGPYIAACNHTSYIDPPVLGASIPAINVRFLARKDLFEKGFVGWWVKASSCIPVNRSERDTEAVKTALKTLRRGGVVALFPEGTRSPDGSLKEAHRGMAFLAIKSGAPIIPAYIKGSKYVLPKHAKTINFKRVSMYFGSKIDPGQFKGITNSKEAYDKMSMAVMNEIARLKEEHGD